MQQQYELYTTLAEIYDEMYTQIFDYDWEAKIVREILGKNGGEKILDAGVGTGRLAAKLIEMGYSVTGVDISDEMLALAKKNAPNAKLIKADLRNLPFEDMFDAAVCLGRVTTYMLTDLDLEALLKSLHRALRMGGILIIDAFDRDELREDFNKYASREELYDTKLGRIKRKNQMRWIDDNHIEWVATYECDGKRYVDKQELRVFSLPTFEKALNRAGFEIIRTMSAPPSIAPAFLVVAKKMDS